MRHEETTFVLVDDPNPKNGKYWAKFPDKHLADEFTDKLQREKGGVRALVLTQVPGARVLVDDRTLENKSTLFEPGLHLGGGV